MLFFIIFSIVMFVLIVKALIETLYGAVLMAYAICLFVAGYSLKLIAFFLKIYEFLQDRVQARKVSSREISGSVKIHAKQKFSKKPTNRIQNESFSKCLPTAC